MIFKKISSYIDKMIGDNDPMEQEPIEQEQPSINTKEIKLKDGSVRVICYNGYGYCDWDYLPNNREILGKYRIAGKTDIDFIDKYITQEYINKTINDILRKRKIDEILKVITQDELDDILISIYEKKIKEIKNNK